MTVESQVTDDQSLRDILTVTQLNQAVSHLLEKSFVSTWVRGEISNFTQASSGHWYFTLKDQAASVRAVMFRSRAAAIGFVPKSGDSVELRGRVTLYEARGEYQLQVEQMRRAGVGSLFEAFLALKNKLAEEGMFDPASKREVPTYPRAIGVITSLGAAALRDVLTALARRAPHIPVIIYPSPVQGADAAIQLRRALAHANARQEVDTVLLVRGGGSLEDLWSFNDEALARDIASSLIPVISGVGHETDFTITDFVADLRAPTPTAAAEMACPTRQALLDRVSRSYAALSSRFERQLERLAQRVDRASGAMVSPAQRLAHQAERLTGLSFRMSAAWQRASQQRVTRQDRACTRLASLMPQVSSQRAALSRASAALVQVERRMLDQQHGRLEHLQAQLRTLSPEHTLARGYAIVQTAVGQIVTDAGGVRAGQTLGVTLGVGALQVTVDSASEQAGVLT
jgi:exodeoxyribonuclease VII large subunit